jgi:hypothetical protein
MIATRDETGRRSHAVAPGAAGWLGLAAAPTFAVMAVLTGLTGTAADMMCSGAHGVSPLSGMVPMYVLMSAFHSAPWLKLISRQRRAAPRSPQTGGAGDKDHSDPRRRCLPGRDVLAPTPSDCVTID